MAVLAAVLACILLVVVFALVSAPLRAARSRELAGEPPVSELDPERQASNERGRLQSEREAKYREIRDAELDLRTGKLSREDYDAIDSALRAEALTILDEIEHLDERSNPEVEG
ncbi:MAG TPA: hypothetical protein VK774_06745 [Solirubrobacteraceae bacterium]|jgi:hypothetical protein|nr:hypothetical protein [Solirubrobacteraceae bacterium]